MSAARGHRIKCRGRDCNFTSTEVGDDYSYEAIPLFKGQTKRVLRWKRVLLATIIPNADIDREGELTILVCPECHTVRAES